jgi:hypothetical protein
MKRIALNLTESIISPPRSKRTFMRSWSDDDFAHTQGSHQGALIELESKQNIPSPWREDASVMAVHIKDGRRMCARGVQPSGIPRAGGVFTLAPVVILGAFAPA